MKLVRGGRLPERDHTDGRVVQEYVAGAEITVAVMWAHVGAPVRIVLPEGVPYSFARIYLLPARRVPVTDEAVTRPVRETAARIAALLGIDRPRQLRLLLNEDR